MYIKRAFFINVILLVTVRAGTETTVTHRTALNSSPSLSTGSDIRQIAVDIGQNVSLPCLLTHGGDVMWVREGRNERQTTRWLIQEDGSLFLSKVGRDDSDVYSCSPANIVVPDLNKSQVKLLVRTPPPALPTIVHPSTILALIIWEVNDTGGYPINHFTAEYRLATEDDWKPIAPNNISPNLRRIEVYKLEPNTTYGFRLWAVNQLGRGEITEINCTTLHNYTEIELAQHWLTGADKFDTRVWIVAVAVVMCTLVILGFGTCFLLYQECRIPGGYDEQEVIELVPNIILNPGFEGNIRTENIPADENFNNSTSVHLNNNTVVQPRNV